ncbi:MAG: 6-pyruvoyl-tetrahydropterin synthase-related protein [Terracidiphilus sp.]|jgi:hypothetical protein
MRKPGRKKGSQAAINLLQRPRRWAGPAILLLAALIAVGPLLLLGPSCTSDFGFHFISWIDAQRSMSMGILYPHWANSPNFGAGEPKFVFYPPLTWMAGAILGMLLPWTLVTLVLFVLILAAIGLATRALAREVMEDGAATLAGCAAIFLGFPMFSIYRRNDFGELAGAFWIPLLLLFALRRRNSSGNFWQRTFDGSAAPMALVVAGIWLTNGPVAIMAAYTLAAVALVSALSERSPAPLVRAAASTILGMGLASLYLVPALWQRNWASILNAVNQSKSLVENNWLFAMDADPHLPPENMLLLPASKVAVVMLAIAFGAGFVAWLRGVAPWRRKGWLPLVFIPPAVLLLLLPASLPVWNLLPELRLLQFPWRWLVVLEAPMALCFASAVWPRQKLPRNFLVAGCAVVFVGISFAAPQWWFVQCGSLITSLQESVREGIGVLGKPEYTPPGIQSPVLAFKLDAQGKLMSDSHGQPIVDIPPSACLLDNPSDATANGAAGSAPAWRGDSAECNSSGWQELSLLADPSVPGATRTMPERKWLMGVAEHAGYLILRLRYYPAWAVKVNGIPVQAVAERARGLMAIPVPQGNVRVSVEWTTTPDVVAGRWASAAALLLIAGLFVFERRQRRTRSTPGSPASLTRADKPRRPKSESKHSSPSRPADPQGPPPVKQRKNAAQKEARKPKRGGG